MANRIAGVKPPKASCAEPRRGSCFFCLERPGVLALTPPPTVSWPAPMEPDVALATCKRCASTLTLDEMLKVIRAYATDLRRKLALRAQAELN